jgi:hypothetical protein
MIRKKLRQSLECGTGQAHFTLQEYPDWNFTKEIVRAAVSNLAYDPQCEGNRSWYLSQLIGQSKDHEGIVGEILHALDTEDTCSHDLNQLYALAGILAKAGDQEARRAIMARYLKTDDWDLWSCGEDEILELEGMKGLMLIAEKKGRHLNENPEYWEDSWMVNEFQKLHPNLAVMTELERAAQENKEIKKYLEEIQARPCDGLPIANRPKMTYDLVKERFAEGRKIPISSGAAKQLSDEDFKRLADDFLKEKNPIEQEKYLRAFGKRKFPHDHSSIFEVARSQNSRNSQRVSLACEALAYFQSGDIRKFAIEKLSQTNRPADYLPLLVSNYEKGDVELLSKIISQARSEENIHSLGIGLIEIYRANGTKKCRKPLEILYAKMNCGLHRVDLLEILLENEVLSEEILREMEFDSFDRVRELFHKTSGMAGGS